MKSFFKEYLKDRERERERERWREREGERGEGGICSVSVLLVLV